MNREELIQKLISHGETGYTKIPGGQLGKRIKEAIKDEHAFWSNDGCIRRMGIQFKFNMEGAEVIHSNRIWYPIQGLLIKWDELSDGRLKEFWKNKLAR